MQDPNFDAIAQVGGWSILAAASRSILSADKRSLFGFLRGLVMAVFVCLIVSLLIVDNGLTKSVETAIIGISGFIADDILLMVLAVSNSVRKDPKEAFLNLIEYIFGRSRDGKK